MAFTPKTPFPKAKGDDIRAGDWNQLVKEVIRIGKAVLSVAARISAADRKLSSRITTNTRKISSHTVSLRSLKKVQEKTRYLTVDRQNIFSFYGKRIRLHDMRRLTRWIDIRADGGALDIETRGGDLYLNNAKHLKVNIFNLAYRNKVKWSSRELKRDIERLPGDKALALLRGLEPQTYILKASEEQETQFGFIAEDMPNEIATSDHKAFHPDAVLTVLTRVVKDQQATIECLASRLAEVEASTRTKNESN